MLGPKVQGLDATRHYHLKWCYSTAIRPTLMDKVVYGKHATQQQLALNLQKIKTYQHVPKSQSLSACTPASKGLLPSVPALLQTALKTTLLFQNCNHLAVGPASTCHNVHAKCYICAGHPTVLQCRKMWWSFPGLCHLPTTDTALALKCNRATPQRPCI